MLCRSVLILAAIGLSVLTPARAKAGSTTTFDWNPQGVGLQGGAFTANSMQLSDFGQIMLNPLTGEFSETGYLPILGFSLNGHPVNPSGFNAAAGDGWGAYLFYEATGVQSLTANGIVASYSSLSYTLYGFNGLATYGLNGMGAAFESGGTQLTALAKGGLVGGEVDLLPTAFVGMIPVQFAAEGTIDLTVGDVPSKFSSQSFDAFNVMVVHQAGQIFPISGTLIEANGGSSSSGVLTAIPEPGSGLLLAGFIPVWWMRRRRG